MKNRIFSTYNFTNVKRQIVSYYPEEKWCTIANTNVDMNIKKGTNGRDNCQINNLPALHQNHITRGSLCKYYTLYWEENRPGTNTERGGRQPLADHSEPLLGPEHVVETFMVLFDFLLYVKEFLFILIISSIPWNFDKTSWT